MSGDGKTGKDGSKGTHRVNGFAHHHLINTPREVPK